MATKLTLRNDFHNTETDVIAHTDQHGEYLSERQIKRVWRALCGIETCTCGGIRGPQQDAHGERIAITADNGDIWRVERA